MSGEVIWGLIGLITSLVTFWLGYRQTVGARKERIRAADREIEELALKRMILEDWRPSYAELERFIAGVASGLEVPASSLRQPEDLSNLLMARALQNDLVPEDKRRTVLRETLPIIRPTVAGVDGDRSESESKRTSRMSTLFTLAMGLASVALGVLVNLIPEFRSDELSPERIFPFAAIAGLVVAALAVLLTFRSSGSTVSGVVGASQEARDQAQLLKSYPAGEELERALNAIQSLTPFAVCSLGRYVDEEIESLERGWQPGIFARPGGTPWHRELISKGFLAAVQPPNSLKANGRDYLTLTAEGRVVGRTLRGSDEIPPVLIDRFYSAGDGLANHASKGPSVPSTRSPASSN
ncbi:hypothetical protein ACWCO3_15305 [Micromonospora sp. NPDC002411]